MGVQSVKIDRLVRASSLPPRQMDTQAGGGEGSWGGGGVIMKALDEACTSCLCLSSLFSFFLFF